MPPTASPTVLLSGGAHPRLAHDVGREIGLDLSTTDVSTFADGETRVHIAADVRDACVVIVQPLSPPVNDQLMALSLLADAASAAGARRVVAAIPYLGYARQERRSAQLVARILATAGVDETIVLDPHVPAIESVFPMPALPLDPDPIFVPAIRTWDTIAPLVVVAPDAGALKRAQRFAERLDAPLAVIAKRREAPDAATATRVLGDVGGRECVLVDDMASTGRTLADAAEALHAAGARGVHAVFTHPVLAEGALHRLVTAPLRRLVTSDSLPVSERLRESLQVLPAASLLAEAVRAVTGQASRASDGARCACHRAG